MPSEWRAPAGRDDFLQLFSGAVSQVGLHVVVIADEIAAHRAGGHIEDHAQAQTCADFIEARRQPPGRVAAMRVRIAPRLR